MKVVLADDSERTRKFIARVARQAGHEVVGEATNGKQAVALCMRFRPQIVILDNDMEQMHGEEAAAKILDGGFASKVVIISMAAIVGVSFPALVARGVRVYAKPMDAPLVQRILTETQEALNRLA
jgi:chemotaxis response regulator CheB